MKIKYYAAAAGLVGISVAAFAVVPTLDPLNIGLTAGILAQDLKFNANNKKIVDNQERMCKAMEACKSSNWKSTGESKSVLTTDDAGVLVPEDDKLQKAVAAMVSPPPVDPTKPIDPEKSNLKALTGEVKKLVYPTGKEFSEDEELAPGEQSTVEQIRDNQQQLLLNAVSQGLANAEKSLALSGNAKAEVGKLQSAASGADEFTTLVKVLGEIALHAHQKTNEITGLYAQILEINSLSNMTETDLSRKTKVAQR